MREFVKRLNRERGVTVLLTTHDMHDIAALAERGDRHRARRYRFEAAHRLPRVPADHKCYRMHGHSFEIEVVIARFYHLHGASEA